MFLANWLMIDEGIYKIFQRFRFIGNLLLKNSSSSWNPRVISRSNFMIVRSSKIGNHRPIVFGTGASFFAFFANPFSCFVQTITAPFVAIAGKVLFSSARQDLYTLFCLRGFCVFFLITRSLSSSIKLDSKSVSLN